MADTLHLRYRVVRMSEKARRLIRALFDAFTAEPRLMPPEFQERAADGIAYAVCDYIAGMTDRYAILEHKRIFGIDEWA